MAAKTRVTANWTSLMHSAKVNIWTSLMHSAKVNIKES